MNIVLVAHDTAPSMCFGLLRSALAVVGHSVRLFDGNGHTYKNFSKEELFEAIGRADNVMIGMSSSERVAQIECYAAHLAMSFGIPFGFYSDREAVVNRADIGMWFAPYAKEARLVVGLMHADVNRIFPRARCVKTGNPAREEMALCSMTRGQSREKMCISNSAYVIQVAGNKFPAYNCAELTVLGDALERLIRRGEIDCPYVLFTPHPGDPILHEEDSKNAFGYTLYHELLNRFPERVIARMIPRTILTSAQVLPSADVLFEFSGSMSSLAAYLRIPVVSMQAQSMLRQFRAEGNTLEYEEVGLGTAVPVTLDVEKVVHTLSLLRDREHTLSKRIRMYQEQQYPHQIQRGASVRNIIRAIEGVIK